MEQVRGASADDEISAMEREIEDAERRLEDVSLKVRDASARGLESRSFLLLGALAGGTTAVVIALLLWLAGSRI